MHVVMIGISKDKASTLMIGKPSFSNVGTAQLAPSVKDGNINLLRNESSASILTLDLMQNVVFLLHLHFFIGFLPFPFHSVYKWVNYQTTH